MFEAIQYLVLSKKLEDGFGMDNVASQYGTRSSVYVRLQVSVVVSNLAGCCGVKKKYYMLSRFYKTMIAS